ncbi:MAG: beta-ketoacyl-[acyl-carrier-protein] synthase family protein [Rhodoferax sp.]
MNQVLVTGLGMICPLGADRHSSFAAALAARSAVQMAPAGLVPRLPHLLLAPAAEPEPLLDKKYAGLDRATQFALVAAQEAMADAGIATPPADPTRFGVFVGIGFGGAQTGDSLYTRYFDTLHDPAQAHKNPTVMHPLSVPRMMANAAAALVSMRYGLRGQSSTYSVACASSAVAVGDALRAIRHGYLDAAVVIGTEAMLSPGSLMAWNALRVMAKPDDSDPSRSCRPFAADRSGFVLGEGAAALVLEGAAHAHSRQATVLAEVAGYGCSSDAQHMTAPSVAGQVSAMQQALREAGMAPEQVQYLNAHGTATDAGDVTETQSIRAVFGAAADRLAVSSTKAVHGHLIGAGGALEFALSIMAMNSGSLPPTAHLDQADPRCDLDYLPLQARHGCAIEAVMSNSFAFGGSNAALLARRYAP